MSMRFASIPWNPSGANSKVTQRERRERRLLAAFKAPIREINPIVGIWGGVSGNQNARRFARM